jgi:hypothetical protein
VIGDFVCMSAPDDDEVVFKWQVLLLTDGAQLGMGYGKTMQECYNQAEMTAEALVVDRAAWFARNPDQQPTTH